MILVLVVLVCGIAFGFIVVERGRNVERRVILLEFQLKKVKRLLAEKKVLTKNNSSTPDTEIGKIRARQYGGSFAYISKKVQRPSLFQISYVWLDRHEFTALSPLSFAKNGPRAPGRYTYVRMYLPCEFLKTLIKGGNFEVILGLSKRGILQICSHDSPGLVLTHPV